jgi:hypothetical protein
MMADILVMPTLNKLPIDFRQTIEIQPNIPPSRRRFDPTSESADLRQILASRLEGDDMQSNRVRDG